jgi:hypothetical protein
MEQNELAFIPAAKAVSSERIMEIGKVTQMRGGQRNKRQWAGDRGRPRELAKTINSAKEAAS